MDIHSFVHPNLTKHFGQGAEKSRDFITQPNYISHRQASNDGAGDKASQDWYTKTSIKIMGTSF